MDQPEQILLDLNTFCGENLELFGYQASPDNRYLAYSLDPTGAGLFTITVLDMESGAEVASIPSSRDVVWAADSQTIFCCKQDEQTTRTFQLQRRTIDGTLDKILYQEPSSAYWLNLTSSRDRAYHFLTSKFLDICEVRTLPVDPGDETMRRIVSRNQNSYCGLDHHGDDFLIFTNQIFTKHDVRNFRVMAAPVADPAEENWRELVPERPDVFLSGIDAFAGHLVLYERQNGFTQISVRNMATGQTTPVRFPQENGEEESVYTVSRVDRFTGGENLSFDTTTMRVAYSSFITPDSVYEIDLETATPTLLRRNDVGGGYDRGRYEMKRLYVAAASNPEIEIPVSLVSLREPPPGLPDGPRPLRLDGYGGFATSMDPTFVSDRFSLIDRGVTYAIAHVRGGLERGWLWWIDGRYAQKENTFSDFIDCAEHLISEGLTAPDRLVIYGRSNGGLIMGVVANRRPDLVKSLCGLMGWTSPSSMRTWESSQRTLGRQVTQAFEAC
jgi:oligopeptidase B